MPSHPRELGMNIPRDMGSVCLHADFVGREDLIPDFAAWISQNSPEIARAAVNLLYHMIRHGESGSPAFPLNRIVPPTWIKAPLSPKVSPAQSSTLAHRDGLSEYRWSGQVSDNSSMWDPYSQFGDGTGCG